MKPEITIEQRITDLYTFLEIFESKDKEVYNLLSSLIEEYGTEYVAQNHMRFLIDMAKLISKKDQQATVSKMVPLLLISRLRVR